MNRADSMSLRKILAEGTPSEIKIVLGWLLNTRKFRIGLPKEKAIDWIASIDIVLERGHTWEGELHTIVGRLNHVGYIIPQARYFLNRLRYRLQMCKEYGKKN